MCGSRLPLRKHVASCRAKKLSLLHWLPCGVQRCMPCHLPLRPSRVLVKLHMVKSHVYDSRILPSNSKVTQISIHAQAHEFLCQQACASRRNTTCGRRSEGPLFICSVRSRPRAGKITNCLPFLCAGVGGGCITSDVKEFHVMWHLPVFLVATKVVLLLTGALPETTLVFL